MVVTLAALFHADLVVLAAASFFPVFEPWCIVVSFSGRGCCCYRLCREEKRRTIFQFESHLPVHVLIPPFPFRSLMFFDEDGEQ